MNLPRCWSLLDTIEENVDYEIYSNLRRFGSEQGYCGVDVRAKVGGYTGAASFSEANKRIYGEDYNGFMHADIPMTLEKFEEWRPRLRRCGCQVRSHKHQLPSGFQYIHGNAMCHPESYRCAVKEVLR